MSYLTFSSVEQFLHYKMTGRKPHPKSKFTPSEDEKLKNLVSEFGENNWAAISSKMSGRNQRQCKERWFNYLSPNINSSPWSTEEDEQLEKMHTQYGSKWVQIAKFFPSRTDINIRSRWMVLQRHKKKIEGQSKSPISCENTSFTIQTPQNSIQNFNQFSVGQFNGQINSQLICQPTLTLNNPLNVAPQQATPSTTPMNYQFDIPVENKPDENKKNIFDSNDIFYDIDDTFDQLALPPVEMTTNDFSFCEEWDF